jgi:hypothetical protein
MTEVDFEDAGAASPASTTGIDSATLAELSVLVGRAPALGCGAGWRYRYRGGQIDIVLAPSTVDGPGAHRSRRLAAISAAAATVNLRLVIGHLGFEPRIELDHGDHSDLVARVSPGRRRPAVPDDERLYAALVQLPERGVPAPPSTDGQAELDDHELGHVIDAGVREAAADVEIVQPRGAAATAIDAALADPDPAGEGWRVPSDRGALGSLVIASRQDDLAAWLGTGRALQAMRLEAACRGLGTVCGVPDDHGAYNRAALGRIAVPDGPGSIVQIAVQLHPITVL